MSRQKKIVTETHELFREFDCGERKEWIKNVQESRKFRMGHQWKQSQIDKMKAKDTPTLTVNRIHKAVETLKAMLTSNRPGFKVAPQKDSSSKTAIAVEGLMQYCWYNSQGNEQVATAIDNMLSAGIGWLLAYIDPYSDDGMGDVKFKSIDPKFVYVDPNSQEADFSDASDIIISRIYTKNHLKRIYPQYKKAIENATGQQVSDEVFTDTHSESYPVHFSGDIGLVTKEVEGVRGYERYSKIMVPRYRVREVYNRAENLYSQEEYDEWKDRKIYVINGNPIRESEVAQRIISQLMQEWQQAMQEWQMQVEQLQQAVQAGQADPNTPMPEPPPKPDMQEHTNEDIVKIGFAEVVRVTVPRIEMSVIIGDKHLYTRVMNLS